MRRSAKSKRREGERPTTIGSELIEGLLEAIAFEKGERTGAIFRQAPIPGLDEATPPKGLDA